jgi:cation:H+ antiporter
MDGIFFLVLAVLTAFVSIKLSYYGDVLSKQTKISTAFVGGLLIAAITSLPEFVTSISAVILDNPSLSFGDILGSNMFNIFALSIYNLLFFKRFIFSNSKSTFLYECVILLIEYIFILLNLRILTTIVLFILYFLYAFKVSKSENKEEKIDKKEKHPLIKFIIIGIILIILSILLTLQADKLTHIYPHISSSTIGAILLGITTSLPEVVSTFALIKYNNYDMAIANILGSNIFNFLVLSISDLFNDNSIYNLVDINSKMYLYGGIIVTIILLVSLIKKNKIISIILSILISLIYLLVWYFQFN